MASELRALGEQPRVEDGGVAWQGDALSLMRANLWLRTASRVLVRVGTFRATQFHELERSAKRVDWSRFVGRGRAVEFRVTARKSRLRHTGAIAERLTEAVETRSSAQPARQHQSATGSAPAHAPEAAHAQLFIVRVVRDQFEISADSSGELLHVRGYRQATAKAPLRETLAAALLMGAGWTGDVPLLDPFCGSGTIPIEAALIARHIAPGLQRSFAFTQWPEFDAAAWRKLCAKARADMRPRAAVVISGSDRDAGAIDASLANAKRAGVADDVEWSLRPVSAIARTAEGTGVLATNPPYGKRISGREDVRNVYAQLGNVARRTLAGWVVALYTPDAALAGHTRLPLDPAYRTVNGGIRIGAWIGRVPD